MESYLYDRDLCHKRVTIVGSKEHISQLLRIATLLKRDSGTGVFL